MKKSLVMVCILIFFGCNDKHAEKNEFVHKVMNNPDSLFYYMEKSDFICSHPSLDWGDERKNEFVDFINFMKERYLPNSYKIILACENKVRCTSTTFGLDSTTIDYTVFLADKKLNKPVMFFNWTKKDTLWIFNSLSRYFPDQNSFPPDCL